MTVNTPYIDRRCCGTCSGSSSSEFKSILRYLSKYIKRKTKKMIHDYKIDGGDYPTEELWNLMYAHLESESAMTILWDAEELTYENAWGRQLASHLSQKLGVFDWRYLMAWVESGEWKDLKVFAGEPEQRKRLLEALTVANIIAEVMTYAEEAVDEKGNLLVKQDGV